MLIHYNLPQEIQITLKIYDKVGRNLVDLISGRREAGFYSLWWDSKDNQGRILPSGIYFLKMETEAYKFAKKIVIMR